MAENIRYTLLKPARLLYSSITVKSAPRVQAGTANPKFSGTFGIEKEDFDAIVQIMVDAIKAELGTFTSPADYYLACMSGVTAARRTREKAEFDGQGKPADEAFKIKEKAEARAALYLPFPGILTASSQYDVSLARLEAGKIIDIPEEEHARAMAGKNLFYPGAFVAPAVSFKAFRRKTLDAKDGVTAYLQNVLFVSKGEKLGSAGAPNNEVFGSYAGYSAVDPTALAPSMTADDAPMF